MKRFLTLIVSLVIYLSYAELKSGDQRLDKPNIIIINVDDLGWTDVHYLPNQKKRFITPHIEKLASEGMVFSNGYAACPVCSPTRASLVTGRSTAALKLTAHIPGNPASNAKRIPNNAAVLPPESLNHLPLKEVTFAEILRKQGYKTAFIGKWHLAGEGANLKPKLNGSLQPQFHPDKQGFDINIGGCAVGQPRSYFDPYFNATLPNRKKGEYLTDRLAQEAVAFIQKHRDQAFLLYLNPYTVHTPIKAPKERIQIMEKKGYKKKEAVYAAMIYSLDLMIGKITEQLDKSKLANSTLIIFTSDNGGLFSNAPLRDSKGTLYEGGIRVPYIVRWPGVVKAGTVNDTPIISYDLFPTVLSAASCLDQCPVNVEGEDLTPILKGTGALQRKYPLIWHYPHYHHGGMDSLDMGSAIRVGKWKYIYIFKTGKELLFDLEKDLAEKNNLASTHPAKSKELREILMKRLKQLDAKMPSQKK